jgi:hypothetical protein
MCRHLALSTNLIEKISSLSGMESLQILSLGRNAIKKIENLDAVAETLEELWISYNQITGLVSVCTWGPPPRGPPFNTAAAWQQLTHISFPPPAHVQSGVEKLSNLRVLFMSNNKLASINEIDKLSGLEKLEDLLLVGNPVYNDFKDSNNLAEFRIEVRTKRGCQRAFFSHCFFRGWRGVVSGGGGQVNGQLALRSKSRGFRASRGLRGLPAGICFRPLPRGLPSCNETSRLTHRSSSGCPTSRSWTGSLSTWMSASRPTLPSDGAWVPKESIPLSALL